MGTSRLGMVAAALCALSLPTAGWAQAAGADNARLKLAHELVEAAGGAAGIQAVMENIAQAVAEARIKQDPAHAAEARQFARDLIREVSATFVPQMLDDSAHLYADNFDEQQLEDLLAFYRTPTGKALIAKLPEIGRQTGVNMARYMPQMQLMVLERTCAKVSCPANVQQQLTLLKRQVGPSQP